MGPGRLVRFCGPGSASTSPGLFLCSSSDFDGSCRFRRQAEPSASREVLIPYSVLQPRCAVCPVLPASGRSRFGVGVSLTLDATDVGPNDGTLALAVLRSALATRLMSCSMSLRNPPDAVRAGHASRVLSCGATFRYPSRSSWPGRTRPLASDGAHGVRDPSQYCSCPPGFGSLSDPLDPPAVFRTSPRMISVGGSAVHSHGSDLCHPLCLSDSRSRTFAAASGFSTSWRAIRSGSVSLDRSSRDCLELGPLSGLRHAVLSAARVASKVAWAVSRRKSASGSYPLVSLGW
jgi:hypothetical protein